MSYEFRGLLTCDGCGLKIESGVETRATQIRSIVRELKRAAMMTSWLTLPRGRYRTEAHYCKACADKPLPVKTKK